MTNILLAFIAGLLAVAILEMTKTESTFEAIYLAIGYLILAIILAAIFFGAAYGLSIVLR